MRRSEDTYPTVHKLEILSLPNLGRSYRQFNGFNLIYCVIKTMKGFFGKITFHFTCKKTFLIHIFFQNTLYPYCVHHASIPSADPPILKLRCHLFLTSDIMVFFQKNIYLGKYFNKKKLIFSFRKQSYLKRYPF